MDSIRPANFLESYFPEPPPRRKWFAGAAILVVLVFIIAGFFATFSIVRSIDTVERARDHLLFSIDLVEQQQFARARQQVERASVLLKEVQQEVRAWRFARIIPFVGRQIRATTHTLQSVDRLLSALTRGLTFAETAVQTITGNQPLYLNAITPAQRRLFLAQLFDSEPVLYGIKADIDRANEEISKVPESFLLPFLADVVRPLKAKVPRLQHTIEVATPLLKALPLVSGYPNEQTYLFLFQNNDELRPTGGFIGTYGILRLRDGEIQSLFTDNIYRLDRLAERTKKLKVEPPPPVKRHLGVRWWFLRDSNWSPDFPTAAKQALWFYREESGDTRPIDGVLVVTPTVVVRLLKLLGSITIGDVQFTPENIVDTLQYHVEKGYVDLGLPDIERKEIIGKLTKEIVQRVLLLPLEKIPDLFDIIEGTLRERHILIYSTHPTLQDLAVQGGWDGALRGSNGDYLMLVDANLAALKTDSVMDRSVDYRVEKSGERLKARVTITYQNQGLFSWKTTRYRTYTRVYAPRGATFVRSEGFITEDKKRSPKRADVFEEQGKTVFGGYLIVEPKETKTVTLEYLLPPSVVRNNSYTLFVQKQAGTEAHPLRVELGFGTRITGWQPTGFTVERKGGTLVFPTDLRVDRLFRVDIQ